MDTVLQVLTGTLSQAPAWYVALTSLISAASAIAALTPTPKDDKILGRLAQVVNVLALNIGHAKKNNSSAP